MIFLSYFGFTDDSINTPNLDPPFNLVFTKKVGNGPINFDSF